MKRIISIVCILAAVLLSSCNNTPVETEAMESETIPVVEETNELPFLPYDIDYNGMEYSIMHGQQVTENSVENEITYLLTDVEGGDIVAEAVYNRTRLAEEKLNIKIVSDEVHHTALLETLEKNALAADGAFEATCCRLYGLGVAQLNGWLVDLNDIDTLDLTNPWWDQLVNTSITLAGEQCIASGDLNYYDDYGILCMAFNKELFTDYNIEEPYEMVESGKWTFDAFYGIVNDTAVDTDGNGSMNEHDFYGYVANLGHMSAMMVASGESLCRESDDGTYVLNQSENIVDKAIKIAEMTLNNDSIIIMERRLGYEKGDALFPNGQALMYQLLVGSITTFRETVEFDFGLLPFPKYSETQKDYHSIISQHWASAIGVPKTCADLDQVGYVLETLGYYSPDTITSAVIEKNIMTKNVRDEDSARMLQIIFDSKVFDPGVVFAWGVYDVWTGICYESTPVVVSALESSATKVNTTIAEALAKMKQSEG